MTVHRRVALADFAADDDWASEQTRPAPADLVESIRANRPVTLLWWGIGYDGDGDDAKPVDSTGLSFDAALVFVRPGSTVSEYVRLPTYGERHLDGQGEPTEVAAGVIVHEVQLPSDVEAWIQLISATVPVGEGAPTHLWLSYEWR